MAAWGGARLDENKGLRTDGAQQGSTDINPMKVRNLAEFGKYRGSDLIFLQIRYFDVLTDFSSNSIFHEIRIDNH